MACLLRLNKTMTLHTGDREEHFSCTKRHLLSPIAALASAALSDFCGLSTSARPFDISASPTPAPKRRRPDQVKYLLYLSALIIHPRTQSVCSGLYFVVLFLFFFFTRRLTLCHEHKSSSSSWSVYKQVNNNMIIHLHSTPIRDSPALCIVGASYSTKPTNNTKLVSHSTTLLVVVTAIFRIHTTIKQIIQFLLLLLLTKLNKRHHVRDVDWRRPTSRGRSPDQVILSFCCCPEQ